MSAYQIFATAPDGTVVASYTEGNSVLVGLQRCREQFPLEEGHTEHYIRDLETGQEHDFELLDFFTGE